MVYTIALEVVVITALIILNGLLAMSEMAIVSARKTRLQHLATNGNYGAKIALELANAPSNFLASIQIGITLIGVLAGAFGGATVAEEIAAHVKDVPVIGIYSDAIGLGSVVLTVTFLSLILGELVPKRIALSRAERVAVHVARPIQVLSVMASPAVAVLSFFTEFFLRILRVKPNDEPSVSEEEVKIMIEQGAEAGVFHPQEESMMKRVLAFGDRRVGELMTQRRQLVCLDVDAPFPQVLKVILTSPHSYYPVFQGTSDHLIGIVSVKAILGCVGDDGLRDVNLRQCLVEPLFVTESMSSLKLLENLKKSGKHLALVVDEYGGTAGLVTIVDIMEAIVGDMPVTEDSARVIKRDDGSLLIDGSLSIYDFSELMDDIVFKDLVRGDYATLAGLVMSRLGHIPEEGESFTWRDYRFEVIDMDGRRIDKLLVSKVPSD